MHTIFLQSRGTSWLVMGTLLQVWKKGSTVLEVECYYLFYVAPKIMIIFVWDLWVIDRWGSFLAPCLFVISCHTLLAERTSWAYWKLYICINIHKIYEYGHFTCLCVLDYNCMRNLISSTLVMSWSPVLKQRRVSSPSGPLEWSGITAGQQWDSTSGGKEDDSMNRNEKNALFVSQHYRCALWQSRDKYQIFQSMFWISCLKNFFGVSGSSLNRQSSD